MDYKWVAESITTIGVFMSSLDANIVVIGLPTILDKLNTSIVHGIWIITGYSLMTAILLVVLGRLADLYGRVRLYNLGFAISQPVPCFAINPHRHAAGDIPVFIGGRRRFAHRQQRGDYH